jgi:hypothetical protein
MYRAERAFWGLLAVGAATAVGVTTHDAGFTIITFIGSLWLPRMLGFREPRWRRHMAAGWHGGGGCAGRKGTESQQPTPTPAQTV